MSGQADEGAWSALLQRSLARRVVWSRTGGEMAWALFNAGPVVLAYPRFPMGLIEADSWVIDSLPSIRSEIKAMGVDLLRMSAPADLLSAAPLIKVESAAPETAVKDLSTWRVQDMASGLRRKFRQAEKSGLTVLPVAAADGFVCHSLYARSVGRQHGSLRYSKRYFSDLCAGSAPGGPVTVTKAMDADGRVAGFLATLRQGSCVYYLHGGYLDDCAAMRPGYLLMRDSIEAARAAGARQFNFLTSPPGQPTLRAYKESFGGTTYRRCYWQQPLTPLGTGAAWGLRILAAARRSRDPDQAKDSNSTSA